MKANRVAMTVAAIAVIAGTVRRGDAISLENVHRVPHSKDAGRAVSVPRAGDEESDATVPIEGTIDHERIVDPRRLPRRHCPK